MIDYTQRKGVSRKMIAKKKKDAYRFPARVFARLLGSFILSSMITLIGSIIDGFLTGRLMGGTEVGACGLVSPLCYIFALIGGMVCSGMENTVSKQLMKGQKREAQDTFAQALLIGMAFALAVTSLLLILNRPMTMLLGARPGMDVFEPCRDYLIGTSVGLPAMTMMTILACGAQLEGENRWAMASVIAVTVTNVTGDCIGIFFFHQGLFTMALVSSFSYYIGAAVLLLRLRRLTFF